MKKRSFLLFFAALLALAMGGLVAACGVRVSAEGQWDLIECRDKEGNIVGYGANMPASEGEKLNVSCEVSAHEFVLREAGKAVYADYDKDEEKNALNLTVTFEDGSQGTARCYIVSSNSSEYQIMELVFGGKTYKFRKIA